jgi:hypothetical protein
MHVLRQLPFHDSAAAVTVAGERVPVRAFQILVWVTLGAEETLGDDPALFPAILDTGHSHNFSIQEQQLITWARCRPQDLRKRGVILVNRQQVPLWSAHLWIHRNRPGTSDLLPRPVRLDLPEGISVYPADASGTPRLPLLGLRALMRNRLKLTVGDMAVSLRQYRPT